MRDVLRSAVDGALRVVAIAWLMVAAPLELAITLAGLVARSPGSLPVLAWGLVGARILVVAIGLVLGRQLAHRQPALRPLAAGWALADLGTLAIALATSAWPANRMPGDAPLVWAVYAAAALVVVSAAD